MTEICVGDKEKMELIVKLPYFQGFDNIYLTPNTELSTVSQILQIFIVIHE